MTLQVVTYHDTITLGSLILAVLIGAPGIIGLFYGAKWKAASDVSNETAQVAEKGREVYKRAAERLGAEKDYALTQVSALEAKVEHLESYPFGDQVADLVAKTLSKLDELNAERTKASIGLLSAQHADIESRMLATFDTHEKRAQERHDAQMAISRAMLEAINRLIIQKKVGER